MGNEVEITVEGKPAPWTSQMQNAERSLKFQRMKSWQAQVAAAVKVAWIGSGHPVIGGVAFSLKMMFYLDPAQITKALPYGPDATNLFKAAEDSMQGIVFKNDAQVLAISARKSEHRVKGGQTVIWVEPINLGTDDPDKVVNALAG